MGKLKSRKFWMAVGGALLIVINEGLGLGINPTVYWAIVTPIVAYIFAEAAVDAAERRGNKS